MSRSLTILLLFLGLARANQAMAEACARPGSTNAKIIALPRSDESSRTAMAASIHLGLSPFDYPLNRIAKISDPCKRLSFKSGDSTYTLYGDDRKSPPRYAMRSHDTSRIAYLALLPLPKPALAALRRGPQKGVYQFTPPDMIFVLAVTDGYQRPFFRFYDAIPDDQTLAMDMCAALSGDDLPIGAYNSSFGTTQFYSVAAPRLSHPKCRVTIS